MPGTPKRPGITAGHIADEATRGVNISPHFTNQFKVVRPVRRVNVDFSASMLRELDVRAPHLNFSRQAVIKTLPQEALDPRRR